MNGEPFSPPFPPKGRNNTSPPSGDPSAPVEETSRPWRLYPENVRMIAIGALLLLVCALTYWFHGIMETGVVFTHLYYIPITLSSLWWGRRGLVIALLLAAILLGSNLLLRAYVFSTDDTLRAAIFILTGYVMAELSERIRRSEAALRASEEKYRRFFSEARVGLFRTTIDNGRILEANRMMARIMGYDSVEELKRDCLLSRHYAVPSCRRRTLEKSAKTGTIQNAEARLIRKDGQEAWIRFSGIMKVDEGFVEGVAVDITRIKRVEAAFKRTNRLMAREHHKRKRLSHKLITELERNQRRLAMELHDQVGQELTTLKMDFELALNHSADAPDHGSDSERLARGRDRVVRAIQSIRSLCAGLRPFVLDDLGVIPAVRELCKQIQDQTGIEIHLFAGSIPERISPDIELAVYRIAQEALTNIVRHAEADEVFVSLVLKNGRIILSVEDNGKGFDSQGPKGRSINHEGLGLFIMEERAIQLGGRFHIDSRPGKGSLLWADFPSGHTDGLDRLEETP